MASLYKRASVRQARILRIIEGAVKNACDAHPDRKFDSRFGRSVAKRATGTLTAAWPDVLALPRAASDSSISQFSGGDRAPIGETPAHRQRERGRSQTPRGGPSFRKLHKQLSKLAGEARGASNMERYAALVDVLRLVGAVLKGQAG